jgi:TolA-binding protein
MKSRPVTQTPSFPVIKLIAILCLCALLAGCGNDQYAIEKQYWQAQKQAEKIFRNPHASPPRELERVINQLNSFSQKYPKSNLAVEADFNIARLYIVKEEYDKARTQLKMLGNKYSIFAGVCSEALFMMGNSYEMQDKWNSALEQYKKIMELYPVTPRGLDIPIYIAQHYKVKYQPDKMIAAFQEAIKHYGALGNKYPNTPLAFRVDTLVAECYIALKDWQNAIATFNTIINNYKSKINVDGVMMDMALLYNRELKDRVKAKETLQRLIKEYPRSRLIKIATALLKELEKK